MDHRPRIRHGKGHLGHARLPNSIDTGEVCDVNTVELVESARMVMSASGVARATPSLAA